MSGCLNLVPVSYVVRCWGCWAAGGGHRGVVASIADTAIPVTIAIMTTNSKNVINNPVLDLAEITVSPSLFPTRAPSLSPTPSPPGLCSDQPAATSFCHSVRKHWSPESHLGSEPSASPTVYSTLDDDDTPGTVLFRANWSSPFHVVHEAQLLDVQATARLRLPEDVDPRVDWILESGTPASNYMTPTGTAVVDGTGLTLSNHGSNMVLWRNQVFPPSSELRFGVQPANVSGGVSIIFFSALGTSPGGSIFALPQAPRQGKMGRYQNGDISAYHYGYLRQDWGVRRDDGLGVCVRNALDQCVTFLRK